MHGSFRLSLTYPVSNISISYFNMIAIHGFTLLNIISFALQIASFLSFKFPCNLFFLNITFSFYILLLICTFPGLAINIGETVGLLFPKGGCFSSIQNVVVACSSLCRRHGPPLLYCGMFLFIVILIPLMFRQSHSKLSASLVITLFSPSLVCNDMGYFIKQGFFLNVV